MSILKLGGISSTSTINKTPNFYLASVIHSQSGFTYPKLVSTVDELDTFFGDFRYYNMYREFILNDIPVLLIPVLTKSSIYNKCSLRLSDNKDFQVTHPVIYKDYEYIDYEDENYKDDPEGQSLIGKLISEGKDLSLYNYSYVLDFTDVDFSNLTNNNYFTLFGSSEDQRNCMSVEDLDDTDKLSLVMNNSIVFWFIDKFEGTITPPLSQTDAKAVIKILYKDGDTRLDPYVIFRSIIDKINSCTFFYARDIDDILIHVNEGENDNIDDGILTEYFKLPDDPNHEYNPDEDTYVFFSYSDYENHGLSFGSYEKYLDYYSTLYIQELTQYISNIQFGVVNSSVIANEVERILELIFVPENHSFENILNMFISYWNESTVRTDNYKKIFVEYYLDPGKDSYLADLEGYKITPLTEGTQDRFCGITQNDRMIEFYSIAKGETGSDITVEIKKVPETESHYEVKISKGNYQEFYLIDTNRKDENPFDDLFEYDYDISDNSEYLPLSELKKSNLVSVKVFDYKLHSGIRINRTEFDDYPEYDDNGDRYEYVEHNDNLDHDYGEVPVRLIEGKFTLSRSITEDWTYKDEINTYKSIKDYEYYPDFILSDTLDEYSDIEVNKIVTELTQVTKDTYSQLLVNLGDSRLLSNPILSTKTMSRVLYFYGDLTLDEFDYCTYYPYVRNILDSNYIRRISESILYYNDVDESELDRLNVNYLKYNNLYYNYNRLKEPESDPDFIIRFNTSKISRLFMNTQRYLLNVERDEFKKTVDNIISLAANILPLVDRITYDITDEENLQTIELKVQIKSLTNKTFILNINLNS